jgi:hypothetical protein
MDSNHGREQSYRQGGAQYQTRQQLPFTTARDVCWKGIAYLIGRFVNKKTSTVGFHAKAVASMTLRTLHEATAAHNLRVHEQHWCGLSFLLDFHGVRAFLSVYMSLPEFAILDTCILFQLRFVADTVDMSTQPVIVIAMCCVGKGVGVSTCKCSSADEICLNARNSFE